MAIKLEAKYSDLTMFIGERRIPEPFCLVDMGVKNEDLIEVRIAEGAEIGLKKVEEEVAKEIEDAKDKQEWSQFN